MRTKWFNILQTTICNRYANAIFSIHLLLPLHCSPIVGRVGEWLDIEKARNITFQSVFSPPSPIHSFHPQYIGGRPWLDSSVSNSKFPLCFLPRVFLT